MSGVTSERNASKRLQDLALTEYAPRRLWCRKAGESLRPEIGEFEQAADLPTGRLVNDQRVGNGPGTQGGDGIEQPTTVTDPRDAEVLEIFRREARQKLSGDGILVESALVLAKVQRTQPVGNVHTASSNPADERAKGGQASSRDNY